MIKKIIKLTLLLTFSLITVNQIWGNLEFSYIPWTIIKIGFTLSIFEIIIKPILKVVLFPINLLTLGLFRIIIDVVGLYLSIFLFSDFYVKNIHTTATTILGLSVPELNFSGFFAYLITSITIGFFLNLFTLIIKKKPKK
jgi:uncharacterized membrane protein YvlD (DUF360 family)